MSLIIPQHVLVSSYKLRFRAGKSKLSWMVCTKPPQKISLSEGQGEQPFFHLQSPSLRHTPAHSASKVQPGPVLHTGHSFRPGHRPVCQLLSRADLGLLNVITEACAFLGHLRGSPIALSTACKRAFVRTSIQLTTASSIRSMVYSCHLIP